MNARQAILKSADFIERNPERFNFFAVSIPGECGSPGCALGWIGHFAGYTDDSARLAGANERSTIAVACAVLGIKSTDHVDCAFYTRMDDLSPHWRMRPRDCALGLRRYADKYHPVESKGTDVLIPASVRAIFNLTPAELGRVLAKA